MNQWLVSTEYLLRAAENDAKAARKFWDSGDKYQAYSRLSYLASEINRLLDPNLSKTTFYRGVNDATE